LLLEAMDQIAAGEIRREKQDDAHATLARILNKEDGQVDWSRAAANIYNRLRGFTPWPGAYTTFRGQQLNIVRAKPVDGNLRPGNLHAEKRRVLVGCGQNTALELLEIQLAGKKRMTAEALLNGYQLSEDEQLGAQA
jgi:methionyl-tRNA formyltransferase